MKVQAGPSAYYYPDVVVTCDTENEVDDYVLRHPCLIVEVLSPSTAVIDKREKMIAYKLIDSLIEYVVVWQDEIRVEIHRRRGDGWLASFFANLDDIVAFTTDGVELTVADIYRGISFK